MAKDRRAQVVAGALAAAAAAAAGKVGLERSADRDSGPSRRYRLKGGESAKKGVRRMALGRVDDALEQLDTARNGDFAGGVHEARKDLKKTRALLRLVRADIGDKAYRRENDRYRDAGRRLSGARDAEVKLQTLSSLEERFGAELPGGAVSGLRQALEEGRPDGSEGEQLEQLDAAGREISEGRRRIKKWPLSDGGWALLEPGLRRSYRRGRRRMAQAREEPSAENVHEWRKRVKDLWYHLRIVRNARREVLGPAADRAHELGDLLGDHHDLEVLADEAHSREEAFPEPTLCAALLSAISRRQAELLEPAFEIGEGLYVEKPRAFSRRIKKYWKAWRK